MKLKRLIIQGFKSFKDRTTIEFDDGITGIVGPNGCGKSNIVDALFWVMGEQSAKHLRGNSMKDVIFAGSSKYNPGAFSEASLVLENDTGKHIHIGNKVSSPSEIQLTRKLYRNGETEYRINNIPCRLRDIQEVFMDTGAGAKSYSIIAQGEINKLVQAKPQERRTMIEEVAGITKFKARKKESMKKIEQTEVNLNRLQDLQTEIEKNLKSLQKQAEKAERARSLKEKVKRNDLVTNSHKVFDYLRELREGSTALNESKRIVEESLSQKEVIEIGLEKERYEKDEKVQKVEELQKEYNEISKQLAGAEERLNSLCLNQTEKEKQIETREKEIIEIEEEITERKAKLEELNTKKEEIEAQGKEEHDFSALEEKVESLKEELDLKMDSASDLKEDVETIKEELSSIEQEAFRNNSKLEEYAATLQDVTQEIEALESQYSGVSTELASERAAINAASEKVEKLTSEEEVIKSNLSETKVKYNELQSEYKVKSKEFIHMESKLSSLVELNKSLEGAAAGSGEFLKTNDNFGILGTFINCDEKYTKSVQVIISELTDTIISKNSEYSDIASWFSNNKESAIECFIPSKNAIISDESIERLKIAFGENLRPLSEVVTIDNELKETLLPVLSKYFVCDDLDASKMLSISSDLNFNAVTNLEGSILVTNKGSGVKVLLGEANLEQGIIERNNRIIELEKNITIDSEKMNTLEAKITEIESELKSYEEQYETLREDLTTVKTEYAAKKSGLDSKLSNFESGNTRLDILKSRKTEVSKSRFNLLEAEEGITEKIENLKNALEEKSERFEDISESIELQKNTYDEERQSLLEKQLASNSFNERLEGTVSQIEDIDKQLERLAQKLNSNNQLIEQYNTEITNIEDELSKLEASNQDSVSDLQDRDDVLNLLKDDFAQLLQAMQEREDEVKVLTTKISKNEKIIAELDVKLDRYVTEEEEITRNIFEKYQIDLRDSLGKFLEYNEEEYSNLNDISSMYYQETEFGPKEIDKNSYEFNRRYGQDLKDCQVKYKQYKTELARLGDINWQAIEDYERQKLRFNFLKEQEIELKESLNDLQEAIEHIDTKSRERFKSAFNEVNVRFEKVFPIIFGGGNARLQIIGDIDDAECGVDIIAQPPGKKMQNINLMSGGEKAMTAVSLIFSIFLVKPSPFCLLDEVDAPLDDANVGRFNELLREMSTESQFILITHNKKTMELNDRLYGVTMQEAGVSKAVSVQLH